MKDQAKNEYAYLFLAVNDIDDYLIAEAQQYRPVPKRRGLAFPLKTAALALSAVIAVTAALGLWVRGGAEKHSDSKDNSSASLTAEQILLEHRGSGKFTVLSTGEELPFFDGESYLVWQYADSTELCISRELKQNEIKVLTQNLASKEVGSESPALACRIWIIHKDGTVTSPHLKSSPGNTYYGELFDYEAELIPSDKLSTCISDILR